MNDCSPIKRLTDNGEWPDGDARRAFVAGVAWWEYRKENATIWPADRRLAEEEAERRYPDGRPPESTSAR